MLPANQIELPATRLEDSLCDRVALGNCVLCYALLLQLRIAPGGDWVQFVARFKGGVAVVTRAGSILAQLPPSEDMNSPTLARDSARQAQTERQTIRVGDRVFSLDGVPQAVWLAGRRMAAIGAPALGNLLSDRVWVWSAATP